MGFEKPGEDRDSNVAGASENIDIHAESIPTPESIMRTFEILLEGRKYEETLRHEDEQGLCVRELTAQESDGGYSEWTYVRAGNFPGVARANKTEICLAYFTADGIPQGGGTVARHENGEWKIIE